MFWRRKRKDNRLFSFESQNQRSSFRVTPREDEPIHTQFQGKPVRLFNIGAVGVAFANDGFGVGNTQSVELDLPGEPGAFRAEIEIVEIDANDTCHCAFTDLDEDSVNAIHRYMLRVQIQEIRNAKPPSDGR